eukprot:9174138-Alexandrium_andersonii.AAC.1
MLNERRERAVEAYNVGSGHQNGAHLALAAVLAQPRRGKKGPLPPLPMTWWCASCHGAARAAKNLLNSRCAAYGAMTAKVKTE